MACAERLAGVARLDRPDPIRVLVDQVREAAEDVGAMAGRRLGPFAGFEHGAPGRDGAIDVLGVAERDLGDLLARRGVDGGERPTGG